MRTLPLVACCLALATGVASGCSPEAPARRSGADAAGRQERAGPGDGDEALALVGGRPITAAQVDASIRLALHDLERARYRLRAERLDALVAEQLARAGPQGEAPPVEIRLAPPEAPRLAVPAEGAPSRGAPDAPVVVVEFVDYASSHCRRAQPLLARLLEDFEGDVRLSVRDLPLPIHRHARAAAEAAHCAGDQGAFWAYHDLLLLEQPALADADLERYARRLGLDTERFASCRAEGRHAERVASDEGLAARLGVSRAPTLFVNGVYVPWPARYAALAAAVRRELGVGPAAASPDEDEAVAEEVAGLEGPDGPLSVPGEALERLPEPEAVLSLTRREVEDALRDRARLERRLEPSQATYSGRKLLKLRRVVTGDLYDRLGLREGDVLLLVDGRFVTHEDNPLWEALAERDELTLRVMRRGLPHAYRYRIR